MSHFADALARFDCGIGRHDYEDRQVDSPRWRDSETGQDTPGKTQTRRLCKRCRKRGGIGVCAVCESDADEKALTLERDGVRIHADLCSWCYVDLRHGADTAGYRLI